VTRTIIAAVFASASTLSAQTYTWTGGGGFDLRWSNPANWSGNVVPASSSTSTLVLSNPDSSLGHPYPSNNDLPILDVGTIDFAGKEVNGNKIRVHQEVRSSPTSFAGYSILPLELADDIRFVSNAAAPSPGSGPAMIPILYEVSGTGSATFSGAWRVDRFDITGDVYVEPGSELATWADNANYRSLRSDGLIDIGGTVVGPKTIDLSRGTLDIGRADSTLGSPQWGRLTVTGDLKLGQWHVGGMGGVLQYNDQLVVGGTLDCTAADLTATSVIDAWPTPAYPLPAYLVLATYGNRIGQLDATTIDMISSFVPPGYYGTFPIVYTSAANAGPGEIRVLLPEPSIFLTVAAAGLLVRRRREE
jgi:hypothetical protein